MQAIFIALLSLMSLRAEAYTPIVDPYHDGFVLVLWSTYTDADINTMLARVKATGASHITIPYFGCQTSITSSDVGACSVGSQDQAVTEAQLAIAQGFAVTFLPIVVTPTWQWRGTFNPTDVPGWFASYSTWLQGVAQIANSLQMKELIVGSEFTILYENQSQWSQFLQSFRNYFQGSLIVTVNWSKVDYTFWADADAIGISTYFPVTQTLNPTQAEIDTGMINNKNAILAVSKKWNRPLYFTEIGFPSTNVAAKTPWQSLPTDGSNLNLQEECFDSFQRIWGSEPALARANVWATGDLTDPNYSTSYEVLNKPAETPVRAFFQSRSRLPSSLSL